MNKSRPVCKVALLNLDEGTAQIFTDAFKQCRIQTVEIVTRDYSGMGPERFDGCVLHLSPGCEPMLEGLRNSPRDRHVFIYGLLPQRQTIEHAAKFGINVLISEPLNRQAVVKTVRATHRLVLHEFRRYVRIPFIMEVELKIGFSVHRCSSVELSGGGISVQSNSSLKVGESAECSLSLPATKKLSCHANVCWVKPAEKLAGLRFAVSDPRRELIKTWIAEYLEM